MSALTHDSISLRGAGIVTIRQAGKGARFTLDSLLLADFCRIKPRDKILEPGTGTGIVSILLAKKFPASAITAVEIQSAFAHLCRENVTDNDLGNRITVIERDITRLEPALPPGKFDVIVANPPYTRTGTGRRSPVGERQIARQDQSAQIETWLDLHVYLKNKGRCFLVFPAARMGELLFLLRSRKLEPKRIRLVHPHEDRPASLALIEAVKAAGPGLEVLPPLIVHDGSGGGYSKEMKDIYGLS